MESASTAAEAAGMTALPSESLEKVQPPVGGTEGFGLVIAALVLVLTLGSPARGRAAAGHGTGRCRRCGRRLRAVAPVRDDLDHPRARPHGRAAVGIDYALFIVNRQRRLVLHQDLDAKEATARAVGTAGSAVFFGHSP